jgi:hypothetical protein
MLLLTDCFEKDVDYSGTNIWTTKSETPRAESAAGCQVICSQNPSCKFFTFNTNEGMLVSLSFFSLSFFLSVILSLSCLSLCLLVSMSFCQLVSLSAAKIPTANFYF